MKTVAEYLQHAREAEALAAGAGAPEQQEQLEKIVVLWRSLAKDREEFLRRHADDDSE